MDTYEEIFDLEECSNVVSLDRERSLRAQSNENEVASEPEQTCEGGVCMVAWRPKSRTAA